MNIHANSRIVIQPLFALPAGASFDSHIVDIGTKRKPCCWCQNKTKAMTDSSVYSILHSLCLFFYTLGEDITDVAWCKIVCQRSKYQLQNLNLNFKTIHGPRILDCPQRKTDSKAAWKARDIASANLEGCLKAVHSIIASVKFIFGYCQHKVWP